MVENYSTIKIFLLFVPTALALQIEHRSRV